ncbi:hypothetical protein ACB092_01G074000 [Castanea dentata]
MASRRSKDKNTAETPKHIVKREPVSPTEIVNRFTPLGMIPKPNYSSVLASNYDPYALTSINQLIAKSYFPPRFHWIPEHSDKKLEYYSDILRIEKSIIIKTIFDLIDKTKIIYHSVYLKDIISEEKWGPSPALTRKLPNSPVLYSYYDYITAWSRFMLHLNDTMTHSWFINFDKEFDETAKLPLWFICWWNQFGRVADIFPDDLLTSFKIFDNTLKTDVYNAKFPNLLHFVKQFKIPWILKWQYEKEDDVLARYWYVKWWDKFGCVQRIIDNITRAPRSLPRKHSPAQLAKSTNTPSTSSTKVIKKTSPFDDLSKEALCALLEKKIKDEEVAANRSSEEASSVAESPYYPYPQPYPKDWFGHDEEHDEEDTPDLGAN